MFHEQRVCFVMSWYRIQQRMKMLSTSTANIYHVTCLW